MLTGPLFGRSKESDHDRGVLLVRAEPWSELLPESRDEQIKLGNCLHLHRVTRFRRALEALVSAEQRGEDRRVRRGRCRRRAGRSAASEEHVELLVSCLGEQVRARQVDRLPGQHADCAASSAVTA